MVTQKLKELAETRARLAKLEQSVAAELSAELAALPGKYGFQNTSDFVAAVQAASATKTQHRGSKSPTIAKDKNQPRRRAQITPEVRAKVKALVTAGKTGGEIAKATGISLPSVQNIKKALGLVKPRSK